MCHRSITSNLPACSRQAFTNRLPPDGHPERSLPYVSAYGTKNCSVYREPAFPNGVSAGVEVETQSEFDAGRPIVFQPKGQRGASVFVDRLNFTYAHFLERAPQLDDVLELRHLGRLVCDARHVPHRDAEVHRN